jgi:Zn-finger nucleic acid-binding protein
MSISVSAKNDAVTITAKTVDQTKVNSKLIFNAVKFDEASLAPNFLCPECKGVWQPKLDLTQLAKSESYDFNKLVSFLIPNHQNEKAKTVCSMQGKTIELFMAVHKDKNGYACCIQKSSEEGTNGITGNWWIHP